MWWISERERDAELISLRKLVKYDMSHFGITFPSLSRSYYPRTNFLCSSQQHDVLPEYPQSNFTSKSCQLISSTFNHIRLSNPRISSYKPIRSIVTVEHSSRHDVIQFVYDSCIVVWDVTFQHEHGREARTANFGF